MELVEGSTTHRISREEEEEMASLDLLVYPTVHTVLDEFVLRVIEWEWWGECTGEFDGVMWAEALNLHIDNAILVIQTLIGTLLHTILVVIAVLALIAKTKENRSTVQRVIYSGAMINVSPRWMTKEQREEPVTIMVQRTNVQPKKVRSYWPNNTTKSNIQQPYSKSRQLSSDEETYTMDNTEDEDDECDDNTAYNKKSDCNEVVTMDTSSIFRRTTMHHQYGHSHHHQQQESKSFHPEVGDDGSTLFFPTKLKEVRELIAEIEQKGKGGGRGRDDAASNVQEVKWMNQQKSGGATNNNSIMESNNHHFVKEKYLCSNKDEADDVVSIKLMMKPQKVNNYCTNHSKIKGATSAKQTIAPGAKVLILEPTDDGIQEARKGELCPINEEEGEEKSGMSMGEVSREPVDALNNSSIFKRGEPAKDDCPTKNETTLIPSTSLEEDLRELEVAMSSFQQLLQRAKEASV